MLDSLSYALQKPVIGLPCVAVPQWKKRLIILLRGLIIFVRICVCVIGTAGVIKIINRVLARIRGTTQGPKSTLGVLQSIMYDLFPF